MDNETESFFGTLVLSVALVSWSLFEITGLGFLLLSLSEITVFDIFLLLHGDITVFSLLDAGPGFLKGLEISCMVRSLTDPVFLCDDFFELRSVAGSWSFLMVVFLADGRIVSVLFPSRDGECVL